MFKNSRWPLLMVLSFMVAATLACNFSFSTAKLENVRLALDEDGENSTTEFTTEDTVYVVMKLSNAPDETIVSVNWYRVDDSDTLLNDEPVEIETGTADIWFSLSPDQPGQYKVEIFLNDERKETKTFIVTDAAAD